MMPALRYKGQSYRATMLTVLKMHVSFQKDFIGLGQSVMRHLEHAEWVTLDWDPDAKILTITATDPENREACRVQGNRSHNGESVNYRIAATGFYNWTGVRPALTQHYEALDAGKGRVNVYCARPLRSYDGHRRVYERPTARNGATPPD